MYIKSILIYIHCITLLAASGLLVRARNQHQPVQGGKLWQPRDYAHATTNTRVKDLVNFFELLDKRNKGEDDASPDTKTQVILSLSESASKLYTLGHGQSLANKCNLYVKLLSRPNIRTVATVGDLMKEQPSFHELNQIDANLVESLSSERQFDALARIQTLIQTLESETVLGKSSFEANVRKELLDCINYYTYRHQSALVQVTSFVRNSLEQLPQSVIEPSQSHILVTKFDESIERIKAIELRASGEEPFNYAQWLQQLTELQALASKGDYEVPDLVVKFLTEPNRMRRINVVFESNELREKMLAAESVGTSLQPCEFDPIYLKTLARLQELCEIDGRVEVPVETCVLLEEERRARLLKQQPPEDAQKDETHRHQSAIKSAIVLAEEEQEGEGDSSEHNQLLMSIPVVRDDDGGGSRATIASNLDDDIKLLATTKDNIANEEKVVSGVIPEVYDRKSPRKIAPNGGVWTNLLKVPKPILESAQKASQSIKSMAPNVRLWPNKLWSYG